MIQKIRVSRLEEFDVRGKSLLAEAKTILGIETIEKISVSKIYRFEGLSQEQAWSFVEKGIQDPIVEFLSDGRQFRKGKIVKEVAYKPGVMNPEVASILKSAEDLEFNLLAADSSHEYSFWGENIDQKEVNEILNRFLVNRTVNLIVSKEPKTLLINDCPRKVVTLEIRRLSHNELVELSARMQLHLNLEEMLVIQNFYRQIGRDPYDAEIEAIAQTWSEHCGHKTFKAKLIIAGEEKKPLIKRLMETSEKYQQLTLSAFIDNAGTMQFYEGTAVCAKVETHNSPSAIEPYGGAMTGSGGVFRDILGNAQGAKPIASTDIFCFADPKMSKELLPIGCLEPHYLLKNVVSGVRDYGNRMGIPTNNGSVHFHNDFRAKPTVIVGAYGILPDKKSQKGIPQIGDKIIVIGGRTGRDGIHGATFSSGIMTSETISINASAVQIGNAIEEKRSADVIPILRDKNLIRAITDCGAGGLSSAIGEMGEKLGVLVDLSKAPLKYLGLTPWEILISESQERMVLAVAENDIQEVLTTCASYNVEATVLGEFTGSKKFLITHNEQMVCDLEMDFLHNGLPQRIMAGNWKTEKFKEPIVPKPTNDQDWINNYKSIMGHLDICSKEPIARQYDHGVQGTNVLAPFGGVNHDAPNDAVVLAPIHGKDYGLVISHGLNPILNKIDPYWGSIWAGVEALANLTAVGGNVEETSLIDNFIWPFPDEESLGALDMAVDACVKIMDTFKAPLISGKDSLTSTYIGKDGKVIKIPPVLCISAFGRILDVSKTITADFKRAGNYIVLVGNLDPKAMGGSVYYDLFGGIGNTVPKPDLENLPIIFKTLYEKIKQGLVLSAHRISRGGVAVALAEMCFGGDIGASIDIAKLGAGRPDFLLYNEMAGCFLVEVPSGNLGDKSIFSAIPHKVIGITIEAQKIVAHHENNNLFSVDMKDLKNAWKKPMQEVFE